MKTTVELPDPLFRKLKAAAAERGLSLKDFFIDAVRAKLAAGGSEAAAADPPWMRGVGGLKHLKRETARVQGEIDRAFGVVEPEDSA